MRPPEPVLTLDLFSEERASLLALFRGLGDAEWNASTVCPGWSVKDIGLHLLGDEMGILSGSRDGFKHTPPVLSDDDSMGDLVSWLNRWNQDWVHTMRRISPGLLCDLLEFTGGKVNQYFHDLDPFSMGSPVSWAGPEPAPVWLDIAREYTERWVHHQQIRDAVGKPGLKEPRFFAPVLSTFVFALPRTFRNAPADEGVRVSLTISGDSGGRWTLAMENGRWNLYIGVESPVNAAVEIEQDVAWRLFTRGISREEALRTSTIEGDRDLGLNVFDTVSIIA